MNVYGAKQLADSFRTVRKNTLVIAEEIPEDKYSFKATPEVMSVAEMLAHIAISTGWVEKMHGPQGTSQVDFAMFQQGMQEAAAAQAALKTKGQIVESLKTNGDSFGKFLDGLTDQKLAETVTFPPPITPTTKSRFEMILGAKEHEMHHRGQLMLVQRLLGMVPPLTRARQERAAATTAR